MNDVSIKMGISVNGKLKIPCEFDEIRSAIINDKESDSIYIIKKSFKYGIANIYRSQYIAPMYETISNFESNIAIVSKFNISSGLKVGIIDINFNECLECIYDNIQKLSNNLFLVQKENKYGIYKLGEKNLFVPCEFEHIEHEILKVDSEMIKEKIVLEICLDNKNN